MATAAISRKMKAVRQKNTGAEVLTRQLLHGLGLRFRLHHKHLPGSPDIVLPKRGTVIFVHGCYWHRHPGCKYASTPKTNQDFWLPKFERNVERDARKEKALRDTGWRVLIVWECETRDLVRLESRLRAEFDLPAPSDVPQDEPESSDQ
ncbi:very short patch repair endonuclease [Salinicola halophyticus]|uniref:very short patch repair endonuclease n=1 Tax=Salinicola halophyticus TaxID=1808881 RepID=UPI003F482035